MSSDPHPPGNCIQTAVSKHPSEGPSLQKGPEKTQGGSWARCQPTETTPFLCVLFFFSFFHAFKRHDKGARFAPYQKKTEQWLLGGMGGRSSPPALHHKLGTCFGHTRLWSSLQRAAVEQQGWVLLQSSPPMGPHSLPPRKAGKSHQESPQKIQDPLTSNARDGRGTSAFLRCSPPPPPPLPHRRPPAPLQKH